MLMIMILFDVSVKLDACIHLLKKNIPLDQAIALEKKLLTPISTNADLYINTTQLSPHQLADLVRERILGKKNRFNGISL